MFPSALPSRLVVGVLLLLLPALVAVAQEFSDCDPLVPSYCMLPFPSNFYLRKDNSTQTGFRLRVTSGSLPIADDGKPIDPADWLHRDGFARVLPLATLATGVSLEATGLPRHWDIGQSLTTPVPASILLDTVTLEALPHWTELDESTPEAPMEDRQLLLWPIKPLEYSRRYIVAYRNLRTEAGQQLQPTEAFVSLRDGIPSGDYDIEGRRQLYEDDIFPLLERAGFRRGELYLAWDFTVSSQDNTRDFLEHMVDDALARLPAGGPEYRILLVDDDRSEYTGRFMVGQMRVPLYLENNRPGAKLVFGADGMPEFQRWTWVEFGVTLPRSLTTGEMEPQGLLQYGHGLFQNFLVMLVEELQQAAHVSGAVMYATNMHGMSAKDVAAVADMLATDLSDAAIIPHGCMQGVINHLVLTRLMIGDFAQDERVIYNNRSLVVNTRHGYFGYSMGGIYGPTILSLSKDINEGVFGVPGSPYVLLLPRARPFETFWDIICSRYSNAIDRLSLLSYMQLIWDHVDSVAYVDLLASNPAKRTQFVWAKGDAQVTYLGHNTLARGAGARLFKNYLTSRENETMYGFDVISDLTAADGHIAIGYEFNVPEVPIYNVPPPGEDTHNYVYAQQTFVDRSIILFFERYHALLCDPAFPCGYDPVEKN